jgi:DNA-binding transcriptional ArsR family regulator
MNSPCNPEVRRRMIGATKKLYNQMAIKSMKSPRQIPDQFLGLMATKFAMLGDETRLSILRSLMEGEKNVGLIVEVTGKTQANVSKHLKLMAGAGLVDRRKEGLQVFYRISDPVVEKLCHLVCETILEELGEQAQTHAEVARKRLAPRRK